MTICKIQGCKRQSKYKDAQMCQKHYRIVMDKRLSERNKLHPTILEIILSGFINKGGRNVHV